MMDMANYCMEWPIVVCVRVCACVCVCVCVCGMAVCVCVWQCVDSKMWVCMNVDMGVDAHSIGHSCMVELCCLSLQVPPNEGLILECMEAAHQGEGPYNMYATSHRRIQ